MVFQSVTSEYNYQMSCVSWWQNHSAYNFKHVVQKLYVGSYQSEDGPPIASTSNDQTELTLSLQAERKCSMTHKARLYFIARNIIVIFVTNGNLTTDIGVGVCKPKCIHYGTTLLLDKDQHKDTFSTYTQHKYMPLKIISRQTSTSEILGDNHIDHPSKACQVSTQAFINFNF